MSPATGTCQYLVVKPSNHTAFSSPSHRGPCLSFGTYTLYAYIDELYLYLYKVQFPSLLPPLLHHGNSKGSTDYHCFHADGCNRSLCARAFSLMVVAVVTFPRLVGLSDCFLFFPSCWSGHIAITPSFPVSCFRAKLGVKVHHLNHSNYFEMHNTSVHD